ncbi:MAG: hypothetical protein JWN48_2266 [Myxococcaceae bacterium]|nr:hypothetical protein [Myxococcaceae bacterium]
MPTYQDRREAEVVHRAYQILRPLLLAEASFRASVSSVNKRVLRFTRARHVIEQRVLTRRWARAEVLPGEQVEPVISPAFDPWQVERAALPAATRQLCACTMCRGSGGACTTCAGHGTLHTWLEVEQQQRVEVTATPGNVARHWLATSLDEADFLRDEWLHRLEREEVLPGDHDEHLGSELLPTLAADERVLQVVLQTFVVDAYEVRYQTAFGMGRLELAGSPLTEFDVQRTPLTRRNLVARSAFAVGALASVAAAVANRVQHPWFARYGQEVPALLIGLSASVLLGTALLGWLRARPSRTALSTWCPTAGALALTALCSALLISTQPSVADARDALHKRDLERAQLTADALQALGLSLDERASLLDEIALAHIEEAGSLTEKLALAERRAWSPSSELALHGVLLGALEPYAASARRREDAPALAQLANMVERLLPSAAHALRVEAAALDNRVCLAKRDVECLERSAGELGRLGAVALREHSRDALIAMLQERFERAIADVSHSRTARVELEHLREALRLSDKLETFSAPVPRSTRNILERSRARAEAQVEQLVVAQAHDVL